MIETVDDYLFGPCSRGVLSEKACESDYWENVQAFVEDEAETPVHELTFNQKNWLIIIKMGLLE